MPGGYLFVGVKKIRPGEPEEKVEQQDKYGYQFERFFSYFTTNELKKYLQDLGMEICYENVLADDISNWLIVISRK